MASTNSGKVLETLNSWGGRLSNSTFKLIKLNIKELYPFVLPAEAVKRQRDCLAENIVWEEFLGDLGVDEGRFMKNLETCVSGMWSSTMTSYLNRLKVSRLEHRFQDY